MIVQVLDLGQFIYKNIHYNFINGLAFHLLRKVKFKFRYIVNSFFEILTHQVCHSYHTHSYADYYQKTDLQYLFTKSSVKK